MTTIRPLGNKIIVKPAEATTKTASGLVIPETALNSETAPRKGEVLAVGPGQPTITGEVIPTGVEVGQTILFTRNGGLEIVADGEKLLMLNGEHLLAVVTE